jgi:hypothetical protein
MRKITIFAELTGAAGWCKKDFIGSNLNRLEHKPGFCVALVYDFKAAVGKGPKPIFLVI